MFYAKRTVEEQKNRLPSLFQSNYEATQIDRLEIDGNIFQGYFEYSFLAEKSYLKQPTRASDGSMSDINQHATFLTPRLVIKYNMMDIDDYRRLMILLQSRNEFTVSFYDIVLDKRVTHKMYFAPTQMPIIYQQYLKVMGIQEQTIELIGTNNDVATNNVTYNYNVSWSYETSATQSFAMNASDVIGGTNTTFTTANGTFPLNSEEAEQILGKSFKCWNDKQDGTGINYIDGDAYFIYRNTTLYAQWED